MANFRYVRGSASLSDIKYNCKVGTAAWFRNHPRPEVRWLSAWRRNHALQGSAKTAHGPVRAYARSKGLKPSSLMTVKESLAFQAKQLGKTAPARATERQLGALVSS